jgi:hypothetical protein
MAHAQKPDFVFRRNGRVHLNRRGRHFSRLLAAEVCASAVVMLHTPRSEVVWRVLATHSIRQFPLHFPSRASPCAIRFQTHSTTDRGLSFLASAVTMASGERPGLTAAKGKSTFCVEAPWFLCLISYCGPDREHTTTRRYLQITKRNICSSLGL